MRACVCAWRGVALRGVRLLSAEPQVTEPQVIPDCNGRVPLHYICTYNGGLHEKGQMYTGAPAEAIR